MTQIKPPRFGRNQQQIIDQMLAGRTLNRFFEDGAEVFILEGVEDVSRDSIQRLISRGVLAELSDVMFGVGMGYTINRSALQVVEAA